MGQHSIVQCSVVQCSALAYYECNVIKYLLHSWTRWPSRLEITVTCFLLALDCSVCSCHVFLCEVLRPLSCTSVYRAGFFCLFLSQVIMFVDGKHHVCFLTTSLPACLLKLLINILYCTLKCLFNSQHKLSILV